MSKDVIVVFGGAFNPPLNSHISLAKNVIEEYNFAKKVIFVPVNKIYNKPELVDNEHRYNMLKIVCDNYENLLVSRIEIDSKRQLYTIETLKEIEREYKNEEIWFAIGSDNLKSLDTWKNAEELLSNYKVLVFWRDNDNIASIINDNDILKRYAKNIIIFNNKRYDISSTEVRSKIKNSEEINKLTLDKIYKYIKQNGLYK